MVSIHDASSTACEQIQSGSAIITINPLPTATIDGTTEWDVTINANTPVAGVDEVSYTYNGTGTSPSLGALVAGNYVTITSNGEFNSANTGTFKVSSSTGTSFTVRRPNGIAVAENNKVVLLG